MAPAVMPLDNIPEESLDSQDSSHSDTASSPLPSGASDVHHAGETERASVGEDEPNLFQEEAPAGGGAGCVQEGEERYVERDVDEKEERVSAVQGDGSEVNVQNGALTGDPGLEVGQGNGGERDGGGRLVHAHKSLQWLMLLLQCDTRFLVSRVRASEC